MISFLKSNYDRKKVRFYYIKNGILYLYPKFQNFSNFQVV